MNYSLSTYVMSLKALRIDFVKKYDVSNIKKKKD